MTPDGNAMDRLREDLIRRALQRRNTDLEYGEAPPRLASEEMRQSRYNRLSSIFVSRRQASVEEELQSPKSTVFVETTASNPRFTLPNIGRLFSSPPESRRESQTEWPSMPPEPVTHARSTVRAPSSYYPSTELFTNEPMSPRTRDAQREEQRRKRRQRRGARGRHHEKKAPKKFLFFFPWVKSRAMRTHILRCFVSGLFLLTLLSIYLALSVANKIRMGEFDIVLILVVIFATMFFCYSLIRLCMLIISGDRAQAQHRSRRRHPEMIPAGAYAMPQQPIPVLLARDEEARGVESQATKVTPPAYGVWRESVRVDPNCLFWQRSEVDTSDTRPETRASRRPPSYASDDGVEYVVEARPRSMAPLSRLSQMLPPLPIEVERAN